MNEKQEAPTDASAHSGAAGAVGDGNSKPTLLPDGTHLFPVVEVSIPAHGMKGNGTCEITWHPEKGLRFRVEAPSGETFSGLEAAIAQLFRRPASSSAGAGAVMEPSRAPQLVARIAGTTDTIRVYQLAANVQKQTQSGTAGVSVKMVISGTAVAATVKIERDSDLSYWHETQGARRLLILLICACTSGRHKKWPIGLRAAHNTHHCARAAHSPNRRSSHCTQRAHCRRSATPAGSRLSQT